jgi:hypothetical protein
MTGRQDPAARIFHLRLAVHLHRRFYHDIGLEVDPGTLAIRTPYCLQGNRYLGDLRSARPSTAAGKGEQDMLSVFRSLDTESWIVNRHLGCFHRRSRACYDLVFEISSILATELLPTADVSLVSAARSETGTVLLAGPDDKPSRVIQVRAGSGCIALRSDGIVVTSAGQLDARAAWRRGAESRQIADEIAGGLR